MKLRIAILSTVLLASSCTQSSEDKRLRIQLEKNALAAEAAWPACAKFEADAEKSWNLRDEKGAKDREEYKKILAFLKTYPGTSASVSLGQQNYLGVRSVSSADLVLLSRLTPCSVLAFLMVSQKLIRSVRPLKFTDRETRELVDLLLQMMLVEAENGTLMGQMIVVTLLDLMIKEKVLLVSDAIYLETSSLAARLEEIRRDLNIKTRSQWFYEKWSQDLIRWELETVGEVRDRLTRVLVRLSSTGGEL